MTDIELIQQELVVETAGSATLIRADRIDIMLTYLLDAILYKIPALGLAVFGSYVGYMHHQLGAELIVLWTVSYTHLTLPTICSV